MFMIGCTFVSNLPAINLIRKVILNRGARTAKIKKLNRNFKI